MVSEMVELRGPPRLNDLNRPVLSSLPKADH